MVWYFNQKRRNVVKVNLDLCFPQWSEEEKMRISQRHFEIMGQAMLDASILWFGSEARILKLVDLEGWEYYLAAREQQKNVILHVAHSAGLEFGVMVTGSRAPGLGPYKPLKNPIVDRYVYRSRTRFGSEASTREEGFRPMIKALKQGKLLFMLSDEDLGPELSVFANFFAESKATLYSAGRLAKVTNAIVLPMITVFDEKRRKYVAKLLPALKDFPSGDQLADATLLNQSIEQMTMIAPEQYMWTLKLFKTRQDGQRVY
ncbi:MAG TPA: lipid A biosynthesis acyltransferase [Gammaproteobacteria bacterium]|nr:lipid A biosynthesis acyltransferase [Gammaproteobacteria bacterium]